MLPEKHWFQAVEEVDGSNQRVGSGWQLRCSEEEDGWEKYCGVLYLNGSANVELSGNTYSPYVQGNYDLIVQGDRYKNIFGTDVSENGVSKIKDKL